MVLSSRTIATFTARRPNGDQSWSQRWSWHALPVWVREPVFRVPVCSSFLAKLEAIVLVILLNSLVLFRETVPTSSMHRCRPTSGKSLFTWRATDAKLYVTARDACSTTCIFSCGVFAPFWNICFIAVLEVLRIARFMSLIASNGSSYVSGSNDFNASDKSSLYLGWWASHLGMGCWEFGLLCLSSIVKETGV